DPFLHKKKAPPPKLQIPLHGKIISASGITNLSEIVAASEEYSRGLDPSTIMVPQWFELGAYTPPPAVGQEGRKNRGLTLLIMLIFALVIIAGLVGYYFLLLRQM